VKILVGWWNRETGELVDIPGFDAVPTPAILTVWLPVTVQVPAEDVDDVLGARRA
jgi:hypothetical protein